MAVSSCKSKIKVSIKPDALNTESRYRYTTVSKTAAYRTVGPHVTPRSFGDGGSRFQIRAAAHRKHRSVIETRGRALDHERRNGNDKGLHGNSKKICKPRFNTDIRKYFFLKSSH